MSRPDRQPWPTTDDGGFRPPRSLCSLTVRTASLAILGLIGSLACVVGCGRSTAFECVVGVAPTSLDFGTVPSGTSVSRSLTVSAQSTNGCFLSRIAVGAGSDPGFAAAQSSLGIGPETELSVTVTFTPAAGARQPAKGTLIIKTSDPDRPSISIPLSATVVACDLTIHPGEVDFGTVAIGEPSVQMLTLTNPGTATCNCSVMVSPASDPGFSLPPSQPDSFSVFPGTSSTIAVQFETGADDPPALRTGTLTVASNASATPTLGVALTANLSGCNLQASPPVLNFGNISPGGSATDTVTLMNDGGLECDVTGLALASGTDPDFSLPPQTTSFSVPVGGTAQVSVTFADTNGDSPPNLRAGTLDVSNADPGLPTLQIPLQAYVNPACTTSGRWIFVLGARGTLARFDPTTLTFTNIGQPNCNDGTGPFSMAVDENAIAWAIYGSGSLYRIDTRDASCEPTSFVPTQAPFGMSFLFDSSTGVDTLYVANTQLATIAFPSLTLTDIAPLAMPGGELAGTGDGQLWQFVLSDSTLYQLDPATAQVIQTVPVATTGVGGYAMKFWGGSFWIFIDDTVFQVPRNTGVATQVVSNDGYRIVGAGVSDCAPVQ